MFGILSQPLKVNNEGMVQLGVDEILIVHVIDLLSFDDLSLVQ